MRTLTVIEALDLSIQVWEWAAQTGKPKNEWPGWSTEEYRGIISKCFLCEYAVQQSGDEWWNWCNYCPVPGKPIYRCSRTYEMLRYRICLNKEERKIAAEAVVRYLQDLKRKVSEGEVQACQS